MTDFRCLECSEVTLGTDVQQYIKQKSKELFKQGAPTPYIIKIKCLHCGKEFLRSYTPGMSIVITANLVEEKANGAAIIDTVKNTIAGVIAFNPKDSKEARANAVAPQMEAGNVWIPFTLAGLLWCGNQGRPNFSPLRENTSAWRKRQRKPIYGTAPPLIAK